MGTMTAKGIPALVQEIDDGRQPKYNANHQEWTYTERKNPDSLCRVHDGDGLYLVHNPGTNKTAWEYRFRYAGRKAEIRLAPLARMTLADARKKRRECECYLDDNVDPREVRKAKLASSIAKRDAERLTVSALIWPWAESVRIKPRFPTRCGLMNVSETQSMNRDSCFRPTM